MKIIRCDKCGVEIPDGTDKHVLDPRDDCKQLDLCYRCSTQLCDLFRRCDERTKALEIQWLESKTEPKRVKHTCSTCKYCDNSITQSPCDTCSDAFESRSIGSWYSKWEKKEAIKCCATCKYGSEETREEDFPDACSTCDIYLSNWEEYDE